MLIPPTPAVILTVSAHTCCLPVKRSISPDYTIQQIIEQLEHVQYFIDNKTQKNTSFTPTSATKFITEFSFVIFTSGENKEKYWYLGALVLGVDWRILEHSMKSCIHVPLAEQSRTAQLQTTHLYIFKLNQEIM